MFAPQVRLRPDPLVGTDAAGTVIDLLALDRDAKPFLTGLTPVSTGDVDLSGFTTETNQLSLSACAGNATADSIEVLNAIDEKAHADAEGRAPAPVLQVSRLFVYNSARECTGELGKDEGTYIRACFDVLSRFGVCREETWPYDPSKVFTSPSIRAQREAVGNRIHGYYKIKDDSTRLDQIVAALRANHPVVFGTQITHAFMQLSSDTPQSPPTDGKDTAGGHAMLIVGYIAGVGFIVKNSWGKGWGAGGLCVLKPEYLEWDGTFDLWVPTLGVNFVV